MRDLFSRRALNKIEKKDGVKTCLVPYLVSARDLFRNVDSLLAKLPLTRHKKLLEGIGLTLKPFFLIDGLDEITARRTERGIEDILAFFAGSRYSFVLASRTVFFQFFKEKFLKARIDAFRLKLLTSEEIELLCSAKGCDYDRLFQQSRHYGFSDMLHNPQTLGFMMEVYNGPISPDTKSDLFRLFIKRQLKKSRLTAKDDFYKILGDLALVMELLERNVVSIQEFESLVRARYKKYGRQVAQVYDKLNLSGLIVAEGSHIRFEHRSLGEFLAAERIAGEPLGRILDYVLWKKRNVIKPSWLNTLSFLIELHDELRDLCVSSFQKECLEATPNVFSDIQKGRIFVTLYKSFSFENPEFFYSTNRIKVHRLASISTVPEMPNAPVTHPLNALMTGH
ncbi:MAG: hypothetical protein ABSC55_23940 [Syntrophorhabdales bacterium]